eukprot:TRINITY_DN6017_c0_g1_i5.p3 TRINITY_DN6017_c0_g1~~TRINITY_DN6017_c0_g1_i5.p3  ORF type:complete len:259 (+),score=34.65 TRINITY_DN6017_c0_g1_i5:96-872(+)
MRGAWRAAAALLALALPASGQIRRITCQQKELAEQEEATFCSYTTTGPCVIENVEVLSERTSLGLGCTGTFLDVTHKGVTIEYSVDNGKWGMLDPADYRNFEYNRGFPVRFTIKNSNNFCNSVVSVRFLVRMITPAPPTPAPLTPSPPTALPPTLSPPTPAPPTPAPPTRSPPTPVPTQSPPTQSPPTPAPPTMIPPTPAPATPVPDTPIPATAAPQTSAPVTPSPDTNVPETPSPDRNVPETPSPDTNVPETPSPDT